MITEHGCENEDADNFIHLTDTLNFGNLQRNSIATPENESNRVVVDENLKIKNKSV